MIPLRARLLAAKHREVVGRPVRSYRIGTGILLPLYLVGILVLIAGALAFNPFDSMFSNVLFVLFFALILLITHLIVIDPRLVVCERGLLLGRLTPFVPFSPSYVIGALEIDPRTVCVVTSGSKAAAEVGLPSFFFQFFAYPGAVGVPSLMFKGPRGADAEMSRNSHRHGPTEKSLFSFCHRRSVRIADEILRMIGRNGGIPQDFRPYNDLQPIPVTGQRKDAVDQIPGAWPVDGHRGF